MGVGDFDINADQIVRETVQYLMTAGNISLKLTVASIRVVLVLISVLMAKHARQKELQEFVRRRGSSMGFLQISTEDAEGLKQFEKLLQKNDIEYFKLPDLQHGDDKTQYLYNLEDLQKLESLIRRYDEEKLKKLAEIKKAHGNDPESYRIEKEKLSQSMPAITVITAEDYAQTSIKEGKDTVEFTVLEASAEKELADKANTLPLTDDKTVKELFESIKPDKAAVAINRHEADARAFPVPKRGRAR